VQTALAELATLQLTPILLKTTLAGIVFTRIREETQDEPTKNAISSALLEWKRMLGASLHKST
jgi:hypothetical protein